MLKQWVLHIALVCTLLAGLTSCEDTTDAPRPEVTDGMVEVSLTLVVDNGMQTRALTDGMELEGTAYENYIDIENRDFRIYAFNSTDNKFISELVVKHIQPMSRSRNLYFVRAQMKRMPGPDFKLVVLANWEQNNGTYPTPDEETTIHDVCEGSEYHYNRPFLPTDGHRIPMYGIHTYQGVNFSDSMEAFLEDITLVRAMAKVEVLCEAPGYELVSAEMTNFSAQGKAAPIGLYTTTGDIRNHWDTHMHLDHADLVHLGSIPFPIVVDDSTSVYVPEYGNIGKDENLRTYITVKLKPQGADDSAATPYRIDFVKYRNGKPTDEVMDIWRNNYYQFVITSVGVGIEVNYEVADWIHREEEHHWHQDYSYPTYENVFPWEYVVENRFNEEITVLPTMYYVASNFRDDDDDDGSYTIVDDVKGAFTVGFRMVGPEGQKWRPAFHGTEVDYHFRIYRWEDKGTLTHLPNENDWIASDNWYQIKLFPGKTAENKTDHVVEFGIATTLAWAGDQSLFLLINGQDAQTLRWPKEWAGTDSRIIKVTQIAAPQQADDNATDEGNE